MKKKTDKKDEQPIPGFDVWPPPPKPKVEKKKDDLPRNASYRDEKIAEESDMAVYDVEDKEAEIDREKTDEDQERDEHKHK